MSWWLERSRGRPGRRLVFTHAGRLASRPLPVPRIPTDSPRYTQPSQDMQGSASPQGEARREAPPRQSEASAAEARCSLAGE
jgi:hypothetical protein